MTILGKVPAPDYTDAAYWNGLIKMSMSKFFILCVLNRKTMHGYAISKAVASITDGCCSPSSGALYPVLKEFEAGGYVSVEEQVFGGRSRKVYTLTDRGRDAYRVAAKAWMQVGKCVAADADGACDADCC